VLDRYCAYMGSRRERGKSFLLRPMSRGRNGEELLRGEDASRPSQLCQDAPCRGIKFKVAKMFKVPCRLKSSMSEGPSGEANDLIKKKKRYHERDRLDRISAEGKWKR